MGDPNEVIGWLVFGALAGTWSAAVVLTVGLAAVDVIELFAPRGRR